MRSLWRLLTTARLGGGAVRALVWLVAGSLGRAATAVLAFPLIFGLAARSDSTWWYLVAFLVALVVGAAFDLRASTAAFEVGLGIAASHDSVLLARIRNAPPAWFTPEQRQRLEQMFATGSQELAQGFAHLLAPLCDAVFTTTFIALGVLLFAPGLAWVLIALVALQLAGFVLQVALSRSSERRWFESVERFSRALAEFSRLQPLLRMSSRGADDRVLDAVDQHRTASLRLATVSVLGHQAVTVTRVAALVLIPLQVVGSLVNGAASGATDAFEAAALVIVAARFLDPFMQLDRLGATITGALAVLTRLDSVFELPELPVPRQAAGAGSADVPSVAAAVPALRLANVGFSYPGRPTSVVSDVSFEVPAGTTLAIVGPSGSGKSTLLGLIAGLVTPDAGVISYQGVPHDALGPAGIAGKTSAVFQSIALVGDTILENVSAGKPGASVEECDEVARAAQLDELIARLPRGWLTPVGEGGSQLSGGERQRVTLARALLKDAPILLLDEATSSLDTLTEAGFLAALAARRGLQTCVIVAHRLNTIAGADRIVFIEGGVVRESGTIDELLALDGRFAAYWRQRQVAAEWGLGAGNRTVERQGETPRTA